MPKTSKEKRKEITTLVKQMRADDLGWETIMNDQRIKGVVKLPTLKVWVEGRSASKSSKSRRGGEDTAVQLKELLAENTRLQALVSDILLGKVKLQRQ